MGLLARPIDPSSLPYEAPADIAPRFRLSLIDGALALLLALTVLIPFWPLLTREMTIVDGDFTEEYFPVLLTVVRAVRAGELPLWNPFSNGGQPLLADPQAALFYPPTWWALSQVGSLDGGSLIALERLVPLHLALAAVSAFMLGRVLLGSRLAATTVAVVYAYSGFLTSYPIEQLPILRTAAWFPLQVALVWLALDRSAWLWSIGAGVAFGVGILAGHPQTAFLELVGVAVVAAGWVYQRWWERRDWTGIPRVVVTLGVMVAVGFGIAAVQVLPTYEFAQVSNRSQVDYTFLAGGFTLWELPMDLVIPHILGGRPPYVGILTLVLAALALASERARIRGIALCLATVGLLFSTGAHTFLYAALYNLVPGFDFFRGQERSIMLFALGAAILAGGGVATLSGGVPPSAARSLTVIQGATGIAAVVAAALWGALYWRSLDAAVGGARWADVLRWTAFAGALALGAFALLTLRSQVPALKRVVPYVALALVALDLIAVGWRAHLQERRPEDVYLPSSVIDWALRDLGPGRVYDEWVLKGNHGQAFGLAAVTRTFPIHLERFELATNQWTQERVSELLNVRYLSTWQAPTPGREPLVRETDASGTRYLYARSAIGPAWVVPQAEIVAGGWEALARVADPGFDARVVAILESGQLSETRSGGFGRVLSYDRRFNSVEITAEAPLGGYLIVSEMAYPSWRAHLDGVDIPLLHADYLLQAVWLPPGAHRLVLSLQPTTFLWGLGISLATLFGVACFLVGVFAGTRLVSKGRRAAA